MDNLTHSLIGYALARATPEHFRETAPQTSALVWTSVLASNIPDADILINMVGDGDRGLTYLMHHRGYTHTFVVAPLAALLSAAIAFAIFRPGNTRENWLRLCGVGLVAAFLHVGFDALNDYGVHPLWPIDNHWVYGDSVFIIEPLFFFSLLPILVWGARTLGVRIVAGLFTISLLGGVAWLYGIVSPTALLCIAWCATALGLEFRLRQVRGPHAALAPLVGLSVAVALFFGAGRVARAQVARDPRGQPQGATLLDVVASPFPGNPWCWAVLAVARSPADELIIRRGALSLAPGLNAPENCRVRGVGAYPDVEPLSGPARDGLLLQGEFRAPLSELQHMVSTSCRARAAMRFLRAPFYRPWAGGAKLLGDLRYNRSPEQEFAETIIGPAPDAHCPELPPWLPPRADLLER